MKVYPLTDEIFPEVWPDLYSWELGPGIWWVCDTCNLGGHRCHFCGDFLTHAEYFSSNGHRHYQACRPDLFDEEGNYIHDESIAHE